jgi:hypothetical protein
MRREFDLGPEDIRTLEALGCPWETVICGNVRWLIIRSYAILAGYNVEEAEVAIRLDSYPAGKLDMAYFCPPLARSDGKIINNLSTLTIDARVFQQWSRHYGWRQGVDNLCSHLRRVRGWLKHELKKR